MPSPVGHAFGGLAVGLLASSRVEWRIVAACAVAAALPDTDFLLPMRHRGPSHSMGAAVVVAAAAFAWLKFSRRRRDAARVSLAIGAAYATHVLFDWLGADSSAPRGLMALWPFSTSYFISGLDVFNSVDRRYWLPGFWRRSALSLARELAVLVPLVVITLLWRLPPPGVRPRFSNPRKSRSDPDPGAR